MKLSRASNYAFQALAHMAGQSSSQPSASHLVAEARGIPERFLLKVLKPLVDARVLHSLKGPHGGYRLARSPKQITLLEVVEAVDGPIRSEAPEVGKNGGAALDRRLQHVCDGAAALTRERLAKTTLADLLKGGERRARGAGSRRARPTPAEGERVMSVPFEPVPALEAQFWRLYRDFFDRAERKRRWSVADDIPWDQTNPGLDPAIAHVVESFCAVELYLPDYTSKILPVVRPSKGRVWFYANWGYEESKHSLALGDWLLRSGQRSDEQVADLERSVFAHEWNLPHDSHLGMLVYAMVQELATGLNYRNLRRRCAERGGDPALERLLGLVTVDELAHYDFFRRCVTLYLAHDRAAVLEQLRRVMNAFAMPAIHDLLNDSRQRVARVKELGIFDEDMYFREVYLPVLAALGVDRAEMRNRLPSKKSAPAAP